MSRLRIAIVLGAALLAGGAVVWVLRQRSDPGACPYSQRFFLNLPRPFLRREAFLEILAPMPGEHMLEVGPGIGYYSLPVARATAPGGRLFALDLQQSMLDALMGRAAAEGITNIEPIQGDAQSLPFPDGTFDAAFLVATLGEVPDQRRALHEVRRVLKSGGRLVVGEGQPDPHHVRFDTLREQAETAGLRFALHRGGGLGYLARFEREGDVGC